MSSLEQLVFRGDQEAYTRRGNRFPYIDHAAQAGATGVHIWFWQEPFLAASEEFFAYCHERGIAVHLGIGVGAYGVCDGEDPTEPVVRQKIQDHVSQVIDAFPIAGIEFQNGEYDHIQYTGQSTREKTRAHQVVEQLNPIIEHALRQNRNLWIRTELNAELFAEAETTEIAQSLDPRCTVEWSRFTGPYRGPDGFERGCKLLEQSERFSWFLKITYNRDRHWREIATDSSPAELRKWIAHWRGWVKLLDDSQRTTLTICNVDAAYVDQALPMPAAAVALARDPDLPEEEIMRSFCNSAAGPHTAS
jgi:hypothetical protein